MAYQILGIPGSLRHLSYNRGLLRAAQEIAPENVDLAIADLSSIPLYDSDLEAGGTPGSVLALKERIRGTDALLIATPEYNYSIPGVLKNAIDWCSLAEGGEPVNILWQKPVALMGASPGRFGTARAQLALRQVLVYTGSFVLPQPELLISNARELFDGNAHLVDPQTRERIRELLTALTIWTHRLQEREGPQAVPRLA